MRISSPQASSPCARSSARSCGSSRRCLPTRPAGAVLLHPPTHYANALALVRRRDARMLGRSRLAIDADRPLRHAVEIRHRSFMNDDFVSLLRDHGIGLVVADTAGKWPKMFHVTSDFVYLRLHGDVKVKAPFDALKLMRQLGLEWGSPWHKAGARIFRLKYAYGPRVTGEIRAWDDLAQSRTRTAGIRARRSTAAYGARARGGSTSAASGRR